MIKLDDYKNKNIHFIAIGGHSMCGLAEILHNWGFTDVSGSDRSDSDALQRLKSMGINAVVGHSVENVKNASLVVYSAAIPKDNVERAYAEGNGIPCIDRAAMLGLISAKCDKCIGVAGTHGKTTTTSMISEIFYRSGKEPTIHIGGVLPTIGSNVYTGNDEFFITEACEYVDSYHTLKPYIAIVLNIDSDHLDYFKTVENIYKSFLKYCELVSENGYVIGCYDDERTRRLLAECSKKHKSYGFDKNADYHAENVIYNDEGFPCYDMFEGDKFLCRVELSVIGEVNVLNSMAAIISALLSGVTLEEALHGIKAYTGAGRRFEYRGSFNGAKIYNDYGHHPEEVAATIEATKHIKKNRLWLIYQPALFSRTKAQFDRLVDCFHNADKTVLIDVYGDREPYDPTINSKMIVDKIIEKYNDDCIYIPTMEECGAYLKTQLLPDDIVLIMGSGTVDILDKFILN
jgi:UDP-N-acetylmuramate--alanine ligase